MKHVTRLAALFSIALTMAATGVQAQEIYPEEIGDEDQMSFEDSDSSTNGGADGWWVNSGTEYLMRTTEIAYDGKASMKCNVPEDVVPTLQMQTDSNAGDPNILDLEANKNYKISFWIYIDGANERLTSIQVIVADPWTTKTISLTGVARNEWVRVETDAYNFSDATTSKMVLKIPLATTASDEVLFYMDQFQIYDVDAQEELAASGGVTTVYTGIKSIDTGHTITKVRYATISGTEYLIGSTYDGMVVCYDTDGNKQWENALSGYMNHDITCGDIDNDGNDEVLASNADGSLYCIDDNGSLLWTFKKNDVPMNSACIFSYFGYKFVACGGYDLNLYYLDSSGSLLTTVPTSGFSVEKTWGSGTIPSSNRCSINFLRTSKDPDSGDDIIVMHGVHHSMSTSGTLYLFKPHGTSPYKTISLSEGSTFGSLTIDSISDSVHRILMGMSSMISDSYIVSSSVSKTASDIHYSVETLTSSNIDTYGYRVAQIEPYMEGDKARYFVLFGSRIVLTDVDNYSSTGDIYACDYSFNDLCKSPTSNKMALASAQSGGSCIHIIDLEDDTWSTAYKKLEPIGNITSIVDNTDAVYSSLSSFEQPEWEEGRPTVYFMSDNSLGSSDANITSINNNYSTPVFLTTEWSSHAQSAESWSRDTLSNSTYVSTRDSRKTYDWTQDEVISWASALYNGSKGMSIWGGHGNDPFYYSPQTLYAMLDLTQEGQKTVLIYPELEGTGTDAIWLSNTLMYPLSDYARECNSNLFIRSKNIFWQANVYEESWEKLVSGDYADVFIPAMEETTDKTMEMSIAGRMGMWCSGAVNQWGGRCARDNTSFDRLRQHSHQMLPNHFLRAMVYQISLGATYLDNFAVDQDYMSTLWHLIAKGLLYVPNRDEIVSINPVHISMLEPDEHYLNEGTNVKWTTFYDESDEAANIMVFSRMNGTWPGAANTEWDFSRYAAGVKDRRLNFLPPYSNGLVLMTPPSESGVTRGSLTDHLDPLYKGITKEYFTDGRNYYSDANKGTSYPANTYYTTIKQEIEEAAKLLPLTVDGEVAWVNARSASDHLRLTLIDGGYINPSDKEVTINFNTVVPSSIINLATGEEIAYNSATKTATVTVPCGLFLFLDITIGEGTGIEMTTNTPSVFVKGEKSQIKVKGAAEKCVAIYNPSGELEYQSIATDDETTIAAKSGVKLVVIDNKVYKAVVY